MGKRKASQQEKQQGPPGSSLSAVTNVQQNEKLLASWTQREIQMKLQCSPDEAQMAAASILSMTPKQLREWCNNLLSETEKRLDEDRRFYNVFMDKKEELGLLNADGTPTPTVPPPASDAASVASTAKSKGGKSKYSRQVDLSGGATGGKDALLPVSQECNCEARKHKLLTNCQLCGKIVCEQEGWGRCYYCGALLKQENKPVLGKNDTEDGMNATANPPPIPPPPTHPNPFHFNSDAYLAREREFLKAIAQRDRLIQFQDDRAKRTTIVDDQEDYFSSSNPWLDKKELKIASDRERQEREERQARHKKGGSYTVQLDFFNKTLSTVSETDKQREKHAEARAAAAERERYETSCVEVQELEDNKAGMEAPIERRMREGRADDEEAESGNICVQSDLIYNDGVAAQIEEVLEEAEAEEGETMLTGLRVMRNPDSKVMRFDANAILQSWVVERLVEYGVPSHDAKADATALVRMTNMAAVRAWAQTHLTDRGIENDFASEYQVEAHRSQMAEARLSKEGRGDEGKVELRTGAIKGSGRIQSDWEEGDAGADAGAADAAAAKLEEKKRKPWVYINTPMAAKLDRKLQLTSDDKAMCMSMHQPWASLLVCGIKKHEGRVWGCNFKGRLFIHAAAHNATEDEISTIENFYAARGHKSFPTHYPQSVLLGCVTVTDVLHTDDYKKKIPEADQESVMEHVFICHNPQQLVCLVSSALFTSTPLFPHRCCRSRWTETTKFTLWKRAFCRYVR